MITLYGSLRKKFGKEFPCVVHSVRELVSALESQAPGFTHAIKATGNYVIRRGSEFRVGKDVGEEELDMRFSEDHWHILPVPAGYSGGMRLVAGLLLVAGGAILAANPELWPVASAWGANVAMFGAAVALGGISSLLMGAPKYNGDDSPDENASYLFSGPTNRTAAGGAVTLIYGHGCFIGSDQITASLKIGDVV